MLVNNAFFSVDSFLCSQVKKQLLPVVRKVYDVEKSTKAALTLLIQLTLLFSGLIRQDLSTNISLISTMNTSHFIQHMLYCTKNE